MGLGFLSFDELPEEDRPPRRIWLEPDLMKAHWAEVKRAHKAKYGSKDDEGIDGPSERNSMMDDLLR